MNVRNSIRLRWDRDGPVFSNYLFGTPLDSIFTPFEVAAVTISVLIVGLVSIDGESHWMEGVRSQNPMPLEPVHVDDFRRVP